jgi:hypothetical protein
MAISFRKLKADEIECRFGQNSKDNKKFSVLLFKTARVDQSFLDEVVGTENWQSEHYEVKGKDFCKIGIRIERGDKSEWVWKSDCGSESNIEAEKGEASDAFKRAGFQWGIGRELYSAPRIWLDKDVDQYSLNVESISYDVNDKICDLVISGKVDGQKGRVTVYSFHSGKAETVETPKAEKTKEEKPKAEPQGVDHETLEKIRNIVAKLEFEGKNLDEILAYYNVKTIGEIPLAKWEKMLARVRGV